ncbi:hypothetical protein BDE02_01G044000 [Populus trichocarpa]|nr:hypothetical protein BDE02_01G044000 [Populus trichocarpa]
MVISSSIRTKSTKNMPFKIVHPGGHIELHDKPVLAAEVMLCNPRCIVAYPHVFQQPWAIAGHHATAWSERKSIKYSQSPINDVQASKTPRNDERGCRIPSTCWFFINKNMKSPSPCLHREDERANTTGTNIKSKANSTVETKTSSSSWCSGTKGLARKRNKEMTTGSPNRFASLDRWQPNLDSVVEEYENS